MQVVVTTPYGQQSIEVRFAIRAPNGVFFTEMKAAGVRDVMANGVVIAHEQQYLPQFEASVARFASQFDTQADAESVMANAQFGAPQSFAGCVVVPSEQ
jgi:hypothetical protein